MKNKKILLSVIIIIFGCTNFVIAQSPFSLKIEGGMSYSSFRDWDFNTKYKFGYNFGIKAGYDLPKKFSIISGLSILNKGIKSNEEFDMGSPKPPGYWWGDEPEPISYIAKYNVKMNPVYLQMPLLLGYRLKTDSPLNILFGAGMYFAYGIGGKINGYEESIYKSDTYDLSFFEYNNRLDFGIGSLIGIEYHRLGLNFAFDYGLKKVHKSANNKNQSLSLTLSYRIL